MDEARAILGDSKLTVEDLEYLAAELSLIAKVNNTVAELSAEVLAGDAALQRLQDADLSTAGVNAAKRLHLYPGSQQLALMAQSPRHDARMAEMLAKEAERNLQRQQGISGGQSASSSARRTTQLTSTRSRQQALDDVPTIQFSKRETRLTSAKNRQPQARYNDNPHEINLGRVAAVRSYEPFDVGQFTPPPRRQRGRDVSIDYEPDYAGTVQSPGSFIQGQFTASTPISEGSNYFNTSSTLGTVQTPTSFIRGDFFESTRLDVPEPYGRMGARRSNDQDDGIASNPYIREITEDQPPVVRKATRLTRLALPAPDPKSRFQ
jgi:hypothetical protein